MAMEEQHITRSFKSRALRGRETKKFSKERAGFPGKGIPKSKAVCSRHSDNNQRLRTTRSSARTTGENLSVENDKSKSTFKNERVIDETESAKERTASKTEELPVRIFKEHNASSSLHKGPKQRKGKTLPSGDYHIKRTSQDQLSLTDNHLSSGEYQDINLQHVLATDKTQDKTAIKPKVLNHPQSIMGFRNGTSQKRPTHNGKMRKRAHNTVQYHAEATRAGQSAGKICDDFSCEVPSLTKTQAGKQRNSLNKEKSRSFKGKLIGAPAIGRKGLVTKTTRKQLRAAKVMMTIKNSFTPGIKDTMPEATQLCGKDHCGDGLVVDNHASNEKKRIVENVINDENKYQTAQGRRLQNFFPVAKGMRPQCNLSETKVGESLILSPEDAFLLFNSNDQHLFTVDQKSIKFGHSPYRFSPDYLNHGNAVDEEEACNSTTHCVRPHNTSEQILGRTYGLSFNSAHVPKKIEENHYGNYSQERVSTPLSQQWMPRNENLGTEWSLKEKITVDKKTGSLDDLKGDLQESQLVPDTSMHAERYKGAFDLATVFFKGTKETYHHKMNSSGESSDNHRRIKREKSRTGKETKESSNCKFLHRSLPINLFGEDVTVNCTNRKEIQDEASTDTNACLHTLDHHVTLKYQSFEQCSNTKEKNKRQDECQSTYIHGRPETVAGQRKRYPYAVIETSTETKPYFNSDVNVVSAKSVETSSKDKGAKRKCIFDFDKLSESDRIRHFKRIRELTHLAEDRHLD